MFIKRLRKRTRQPREKFSRKTLTPLFCNALLLLLLLFIVVAKEEKDLRGTVGVDKTLLDFRALFDEDEDVDATMPHFSMNTS